MVAFVLASPLGGDVETQTFFDNMGGDVTQNDEFQRKTALQACKRFSRCARLEAML